MRQRLLAMLLHYANADPPWMRTEFYALKQRLLFTRDAVIDLCDVVAHLVNRVEELESKHDVSSRRLDAADRAARKGVMR